MMEFVEGVKAKETLGIAQILEGSYEGKKIRMNGAVHNVRDMGEVAFVILRKAEGLVQCVYEEGKAEPASDHAPIYLRKSQAERELEAKGKKLEE